MRIKVLICFISVVSFLKGNTQTALEQVSTKKIHTTLFDSDKPLDILLTGNTKGLLNDRTGEAKYFPFTLSYSSDDSGNFSVPVNIKTRGHFRRMQQNCLYPPLLIHFKDTVGQAGNLFPANAKLKLVMPCKGDEYVVREWMVYKMYNLLSDESFKARLVKLTLESDKSKKSSSPFWGILLEDEHAMADRNHSISINKKIRREKTELNSFLAMSVFQYLIGNTDWSVEFMQNIKLIAKDSSTMPIPVPYDFDHAGIVNAPYALPAEELQLASIRTRRYRGYCINDMKVFDSTIALYNKLKENIYSLYTTSVLLNKQYINSTIEYLNGFYKTINNPKLLLKEFGYPCDKNGTGNVIIKGLKED